jgi:hypothetical protein
MHNNLKTEVKLLVLCKYIRSTTWVQGWPCSQCSVLASLTPMTLYPTSHTHAHTSISTIKIHIPTYPLHRHCWVTMSTNTKQTIYMYTYVRYTQSTEFPWLTNCTATRNPLPSPIIIFRYGYTHTISHVIQGSYLAEWVVKKAVYISCSSKPCGTSAQLENTGHTVHNTHLGLLIWCLHIRTPTHRVFISP